MPLIVKIVNLALSVILLNTLWSLDAQLLSEISVVLGNKHYYVDNINEYNFYQAAYACAKLDMKLASFEAGSKEDKNLYTYIFNTNDGEEDISKGYWLSGTNIGTPNSKYYWLGTGKRSTTDKSTANQCLYRDANFEEAEDSCTSQHYYICEKPLEPNCGKLGQCRGTNSTRIN